MKILIIEDEYALADAVAEILKNEKKDYELFGIAYVFRIYVNDLLADMKKKFKN